VLVNADCGVIRKSPEPIPSRIWLFDMADFERRHGGGGGGGYNNPRKRRFQGECYIHDNFRFHMGSKRADA
jgi:hypothetical protein